MAKLGYKRVSSFGQNLSRQLEGFDFDKVFEDKVSGKSIKRPALEEMLSYARENDEIFCHSLDRMARNLSDLLKLIEDLNKRGISVTFVKENLSFKSGDNNPMAKLQLQIIGAVAEFERSLIKERQLEGVEIAKKKGVYKGRKPTLNKDQIKEVKMHFDNGMKKTEIAKMFNISRESVYRYAKV